jgi:hypothetical protein
VDDHRRDWRRVADEVGRRLAEHGQLGTLLQYALARCREVLDAEATVVLLVRGAQGELYCPYIAEHGPAADSVAPERRFPADQGIVGSVLRSRTAVRVDEASADPNFVAAADQPTARRPRALLCAPLVAPGGVIGVIEAVNVHGAAIFDEQDQALLEALAQHLALAVENANSAARESGLGAQELEPRTQNPAPDTPGSATVFRKEGDYWTVAFAGHVARLKDAKGLQYIAHLLRHPGQEFHVSQLIAAIGDAGADLSPGASSGPIDWDARASDAIHERGLGDAGPVLDAKAKAEYKRRIDDLRSELEEAERFNDPGRAARAREEIEVISEQLTAAVGLGGRDRHAASEAERARLAVTKRIKAALAKIRDANPALAQHLTAAITTGYFCSYAPKADTPTSWSLE